MNKNKVIPHLIACSFFLVLSLAYFLPTLQGEQIDGHDNNTWLGGAKEVLDFREKYGTDPLWTNRMFSGMPAYQISMMPKGNMLATVYNALIAVMNYAPLFILLAMLSFYVLMLTLRVDWKLAISGAVGFAFCSFNFIMLQAGHNSQVLAIALMPLLVAGILLAYRGNLLLGAALTSFAATFQVMANHVQITYYLLILIGIMIISQLIFAFKEGKIVDFIKASLVLAIAGAIGVASNASTMLTTYEYGKDSTRGKSELKKEGEKATSGGLDIDYAFAWSYGKSESFVMLVPNALGGPSQQNLGEKSQTYETVKNMAGPDQAAQLVKTAPTYRGDQPTTNGAFYMGAIMIFCFVLGMFLADNKLKWWVLTGTLLAIILSWGKNFMIFNEPFFNLFPLYNKFRSVSFVLVIVSFTVPFMATIGIKEFFNKNIDEQKRKKALLHSFYGVGGMLVLMLLAGFGMSFIGSVDDNFKQYNDLLVALRADRARMFKLDTLRSLLFVSAAFGVLWFALKKKINYQWLVIILPLLVVLDQWPIAKRYLNDTHFKPKTTTENPFIPTEADNQILQDKELGFRVMNTSVSTFNDASTSFFHNSIVGYHGAKLERYQELIENQIAKQNMSVLNMLNAKYFIVQSQGQQGQQGGPPMAQQNPGRCGSAWFVPEYKLVADASEEMKSLDKFDPKQITFIDKRYSEQLNGFKISFDSTASIKLTQYLANHLIYEYSCNSSQLAVFSEIFYDKGWNAYIDGKLVPHFRCNYVLRGMVLPAGNHKIDFKFEPAIYAKASNISMIASSLMLLIFLGGIGWSIFKKESLVTTEAKPSKGK
ncbi:MAG: YfhO family protein [Bacteroidetes bacterium]|nr:YfhO family protein [Bacteroidota bacterium]